MVLDMEAAKHGPLPTHPLRVTLTIQMKEPSPNGLRSEEEAKALFKLEDDLLEAITSRDLIYLGRSVSGGTTDLFLYGKAELDLERVQRKIDRVRREHEYQVELDSEEDPDWEAYFEWLYPDPVHFQLMMNRRVLENLARHGDQHGVPRPIEHYAYFRSEAEAAQAAEQLRGRGFEVQAPVPPKEGESEAWGLPFTRVDSVDQGRADEFTVEILEVLAGCNGEYDGWGTTVQAN
jgi:regulator of RNase E activity RraB